MAERIEDYALVGDLQTAALDRPRAARSTGCCFPRFDSGSCFGALLGTHEHGHWGIAPVDGGPATRAATAPDTLILESEWQTPTGRVRVIDFMPPRERGPDIVRIVEGLEGTCRDDDRARDPLRLRLGRPVGPPARRRDAGRGRRAGRPRAAHAGRPRAGRHDARRRVPGARGRARAVRAHLVPVASRAAAAGRRRARARRDGGVLAGVDRAAARYDGRVPGGGAHVARSC